MAKLATIDMRSAMARTTLTITVKTKYQKEMKIRVWIAGKIIAFAAWVGGFKAISMDWED